MRLPPAMLVDLDDTILDDSGSRDGAWRTVCEEAASRVHGLDSGSLRGAVERERTWYWSDPARHREGRMDLRAATALIVARAMEQIGVALPGLATEMAERLWDIRETATQPFPGAVDTLAALRHRGVRLALLTNGSAAAQRAKIDRFALTPLFDAIFVEGEFGAGKPDERVYRAALRALNAEPADAWSVGDNLEWDVAAPQRLGLYGVWVDAAGAGLPDGADARPDRIVRSITELLPPDSRRWP